MDISALNGNFSVAMMRMGEWNYEWNRDRTLSIWGEAPFPVDVDTRRGDFIEAVDESGRVVCEGGDGGWFRVPVVKKKTTLRFKKLPNPKLSKAALDKARETVTRYLVSDAPYNLKIPDSLDGAIKWMQGKLKEIPASSRAKASFRFDTSMSYGETYPNIEISYQEPEADAEVIRRIQVDAERTRIKTDADRAKFENLKSRFATV